MLTTKEQYEKRIEDLQEMIKNTRSGKVYGDIKAIKKIINKCKIELDKINRDML